MEERRERLNHRWTRIGRPQPKLTDRKIRDKKIRQENGMRGTDRGKMLGDWLYRRDQDARPHAPQDAHIPEERSGLERITIVESAVMPGKYAKSSVRWGMFFEDPDCRKDSPNDPSSATATRPVDWNSAWLGHSVIIC